MSGREYIREGIHSVPGHNTIRSTSQHGHVDVVHGLGGHTDVVRTSHGDSLRVNTHGHVDNYAGGHLRVGSGARDYSGSKRVTRVYNRSRSSSSSSHSRHSHQGSRIISSMKEHLHGRVIER